MSVSRSQVTGPICTPAGDALPGNGQIVFALQTWDLEDGEVLLHGQVVAPVVDGDFAIDLWRTIEGERGSTYRVTYVYWSAATSSRVGSDLGIISLAGAGPYQLADLLTIPAPTPDDPDIVDQVLTATTQALAAAAAAEVSASNAQSSSRTLATWTSLSGLTGAVAGEGAEVLDTDTGTHTDPVVGGSVANAGRYLWSTSPAGWKWIGETGLAGKTSTAIVNQTGPSGAEVVISDARGFRLARIGATRARASGWEVGEDALRAAGLTITSGDANALRVRDARGFYYDIQSHGSIIRSTARAGVWLGDRRGFMRRIDAPPEEAIAQRAVRSDGRNLWAVRARLGAIKAGAGATARLVLTGDSWIQRNVITSQYAAVLNALYGQGASGWVSLAQSEGPPSGVTLSRAGFDLHDMTAERGSLAGPYGLSGDWIGADDTGASLTLSGLRGTTIHVFYRDGAGDWRYRVDGGSWTTVTGGGTGADDHVTVGGLASGSTHVLEIDTSVNSDAGQVSIAGVYATGLAGAEMIIAGNSEARASDYAAVCTGTMFGEVLGVIQPDCATVILGTNDVAGNVAPATYRSGLLALAGAYQAARADCCVVFAASCQSSWSGTYPMSDYTDAAIEAHDLAALSEVVNLYDLIGPYATTSGLGIWADGAHPNTSGGRLIANHLILPHLHLI